MKAQFGAVASHARTETHFRQAALQRHLATLETHLVESAGTRVLTLLAAAAGLALAR
jgi:hypothetical protein